MVSDSSVDCGARSISSPVRSAIRSIKEVVGDRSDADVVAVLAETHMDPNEAAQRLLAQSAHDLIRLGFGGTFTEHHTREQEERKREVGNIGRKHQLIRKASANGYKAVMDNDEIMIPGTIYQTWLHGSLNLISKRGRLIKDKVQDPFLDLIREVQKEAKLIVGSDICKFNPILDVGSNMCIRHYVSC